MNNQFGRTSAVRIKTAGREGKTILEDVRFTAPFKVAKPFPKKDGGLEVMILSASAGVMAGDRQEIDIRAGKGSCLKCGFQSFEKIHRMETDRAERRTELVVESGARLDYFPPPVIPFAGSRFGAQTIVRLEDESARLTYREVLSCGRSARRECFGYEEYSNRVTVFCRETPIYYENASFFPGRMDLSGPGMYEGYTHMLTALSVNAPEDSLKQERIRAQIASRETCEGGVTRNARGDLILKALGYSADALMELSELLL